jgi:hypothetical protein
MKMDTNMNKVVLFMDHAQAVLIDANEKRETVQSLINSHERVDGETGDGTRLGDFRSTNNESHKHNIRIDKLNKYYKHLAQLLMPYNSILIMGPTTAPVEFQNYCLTHKVLHGKKLKVEKVNYLTENQAASKFKEYFNAKE